MKRGSKLTVRLPPPSRPLMLAPAAALTADVVAAGARGAEAPPAAAVTGAVFVVVADGVVLWVEEATASVRFSSAALCARSTGKLTTNRKLGCLQGMATRRVLSAERQASTSAKLRS